MNNTDYTSRAKALYGDTAAYKEFEQNTAGQSREEMHSVGDGLMQIISVFGRLKEKPASDPEVQAQWNFCKNTSPSIITHARMRS